MDILDFGKHKGESWGKVPRDYLNWLANQPTSENVERARKEIERRGTAYPTVEISGHAIDRASLRCLKIYLNNKNKGEGLYSWLIRISNEAIVNGEEKIKNNIYRYKGIDFIFKFGEIYPVLKSVFYKK